MATECKEVSSCSDKSLESQDQVDDDDMYYDIGLLENAKGITKDDIEKIRAQGIVTIKGVQIALGSLRDIGIDDGKVETLKLACSSLGMSSGFMPAIDIVSSQRIPTSCSDLEYVQKLFLCCCSVFFNSILFQNLLFTIFFSKILGGGLELGSITEVFGESGCGKTQFCLMMCAAAQIPSETGNGSYPGGKVIYIDTENTLYPFTILSCRCIAAAFIYIFLNHFYSRSERVSSIADNLNLDKKLVLSNILYAKAISSENLKDLLRELSTQLIAEPNIYKLLIVDSVIFHYKSTSMNSDNMKRQQSFRIMLSKLKNLVEEFKIAVLITNHVTVNMANPLSTEEYKPAGGLAISQISTTRVQFKKTNKLGLRKVLLYSSPDLEECEVDVFLGPKGIENRPNDI